MFGNLFKPKIEHQDPEVRLSAVRALTGDNNVSTLSRIALDDVDKRVREQALKQLQREFSDQHELDSTSAAKLFAIATDRSFTERLITHITAVQECEGLVSKLEDDEILILFVLNSPIPAVRKSAAEKISNLDSLKQLQIQSTDKNVLKIVRQKIQQIKAEQKDRLTAQGNLTQICEALERLAKSDYDHMTTNRVRILQFRWQEIEDQYKPDFEQRYQKALQACEQVIMVAKEQAAQEEYQLAQNQLCQSLCDSLEEQIQTLDASSTDLWSRKTQEISEQWQQTCRDFTPDAETNERFHNLIAAVQKLTDVIQAYGEINRHQNDRDNEQKFEDLCTIEQQHFLLCKQLTWPFSIPQPKFYEQIRNNHKELKNLLKIKQKEHHEKRFQIDKKVTILKSHIRQKNLIKANRLFNYIQNLLDELPVSIQEQEQQKLISVTQSLNELRGLNKFVTAPIKQDLCEQMEALIDVQIEPEQLMQQIKTIQDKWKSLATSDAEADDILWNRFKRAADKAYEPCERYLKELEKIKHANLKQRQQLVNQVESELSQIDWQHVDWKQIQTQYTQNWKKWNALTPVFFSENKPVQQHFESLMHKIKAKLNDEKNENHSIYDQLIERASDLVEGLEQDNIDDSVEQIKKLQASWKNVGITHLNKSRKQWNKFRKLCDQVFEFKRKQHKTLLAEQDQQADSAYKIIDKIKALKQIPDQNLPASQSDYRQLKAQFEQIYDLPDNRQERIRKRFQQVCDEYESHFAGLPERSRMSNHVLIRKAAQLCSTAECLAMDEKDLQRFETLKAEFEKIDKLPEKIQVKFVKRIDQAEKVISDQKVYTEQELIDNEQSLAALAIKLEVLLDLETPAHAKQQRMNYQLEQLQAGLKPTINKQERLTQVLEYELQWYSVGAIDPESRTQLESRLQAAIKQAET